MIYREFTTEDVEDWIEDDAQDAYALYKERGSGSDTYGCAIDGIGDRMAWSGDALAIIAWSGNVFDACSGDCSCYEDSPAHMYEEAVHNRLLQLINEHVEEDEGAIA